MRLAPVLVRPALRLALRLAICVAIGVAPIGVAADIACCQAESDASPEAQAEQSARPWRIDGSVDLRYLGRFTDGKHDNDLYAYTDLDVGDAHEDVFTAHLAGRVAWDIDRDRDPTHPFRSVDDSFSGDVTARLYGAWVDVNGVGGNPLGGVLRRVRVGRQVTNETPRALFLDGVSVQTQPATSWLDLQWTGYAGLPSHLFESSPSGDLAAGGSVGLAPWTGGRLRLDYMHVTDEYWFSTQDDDLVGLRWDQRIGDHLFCNVFANVFDFDRRGNVGAYAAWSQPEDDFTLTVRYSGLLDDERRRSIDFDYFTQILADYAAYDQLDVAAHKGFGSAYVDGGAQARELRHDAKESLLNHEFRRYHATIGTTQWPWPGSDASVTYELWDAGGDRFTAVGADFTRKFDATWSGSVGTFFQLFRYDALRGTENESVQVTYLKVVYQVSTSQRLRARVEYEDGEYDDYLTLVLSTQIDF